MPDTQEIIPPEKPALMRVWDAEKKQIILVPAPPAGPDMLTLTVRLHDPKEKNDAAKSAVWHVMQISREDLKLAEIEFAAKHFPAAAAVILAPHKK